MYPYNSILTKKNLGIDRNLAAHMGMLYQYIISHHLNNILVNISNN